MMTIAEAMSPQGSVLGAVFTLLLYGVLPLSVLLYVLGTPQRRAARQRAEASALAAEQAHDSGHAPAGGAAAEGEKT
ncbi:hypothetical protein ACG0Z6_13990 [Roseateles sp. BYS180W]|uniref:Heme exporter protein D n=1 Tax=Roseateles rivi TaxID=3299028 RepID=A0ABW7FYC1_9BURK